MLSPKKAILCTIGFTVALATACLIPDRDIVIIVTDPCGEEWAAQTVGAYGYNGVDAQQDIKTDDEKWLTKSYCLNADQAEQIADPTSDLAADVLLDIAQLCQARALELGLGGAEESCLATADIAYIGPCMSPPAGCSEGADGGGTDGGETGQDPGAAEDFASLDLRAEVTFVAGEYVVSQHLITTALADPVGTSNDGTTAAQVFDTAGSPYGFEIRGVTPGKLGYALGLQNGDLVVEVAGLPTASYEDLLELAGALLVAEQASVIIERGGSTLEQRYRRGK